MPLRMLHAILLISSLTFISGCALLEPPDDDTINQKQGPAARVYKASYDEVWRALQKTLIKYPIVVNNIDQGVLETEPVKVDSIWARPYKSANKNRVGKFTLHVNVIKGRIKGAEATRLMVLKKVAVGRDFFSDDKYLPSDGFEEDIIIYRVHREIVLERSLKKAFEKGSSSDGFDNNFDDDFTPEGDMVPENEIEDSINQ